MVNIVDSAAVIPTRYQDFQMRTADGLNKLHTVILKGWPDTKSETPHSVREYWPYRNEHAVYDGIVYKGMRIASVRSDMLKTDRSVPTSLPKKETHIYYQWTIILRSLR